MTSEFIVQKDGHNCGPIACLKFMELFGFTTLAEINKKLLQPRVSYRTLVLEQQQKMIEYLKDELVASRKINKTRITEENSIICVCNNKVHSSIISHEMKCCGVTFEKSCLDQYLRENNNCPFCMKEVPTNKDHEEDVGEERLTDIVRAESVRKKRLHQETQGHKMVRRYKASIEEKVKGVAVGSVVTIWVDPRVAAHARGILAIVVDVKVTGGIIACSAAGIIVNGKGKKEWWISGEGYLFKEDQQDMTNLPPELIAVRNTIMGGTFDRKTHRKCTIAEAHQVVVGASSPCGKSTCVCLRGKCTKRCGCYRGKRGCTSSCACNGNCVINPLNHNK